MAAVTLEAVQQVEQLLPALRGCIARCNVVESGETVEDSLGGKRIVLFTDAQKAECESAKAAKLAEVQALVAGWTA